MKISLLSVENIINRKNRRPRQELTFFIRLENIDFHKQVDVVWAGEDGIWRTTKASFYSHLKENVECWRARIMCELKSEQSLPGNIHFGLRYRVSDQEYWDNRQGANYQSEADSGILLGPGLTIASIGFNHRLEARQKSRQLMIAVDRSLQPEKVIVHWTTNDWQTTHQTACHFRHDYWNEQALSNARNPNQYGIGIWTARLRIGTHFRLQYCIACETAEGTVWDNNDGANYVASHKPLSVMVLNLHCYQEDNQDEKFSIIAKAIDNEDVDVVCFQEVAENWNDGQGDWDSNSANIINQRLKKPFHLYSDWSHLGFERYREGVALLSRYPFLYQESRYISDSEDVYNIHSRKAVMGRVRIPYIGLINVFSVHLSWWEDGFKAQFQRLCEWAGQRHGRQVKATLLCGDFNVAAGSEGYRLIVENHRYEDQFLAANHKGLFDQIFRVNDAHWGDLLNDDYRIDYIFMNKDAALKVTSARVLFTHEDYGQVSDHVGFVMTFEPK